MLSRLTILLPLVFTLVAFILSNLCLFAGRDKGFMEDYAIARLNTSMLGHNLLESESSDNSTSSDDDDDDDSLLDWAKDEWDDIKDDIQSEINNITGEIADAWADALGIQEWYSLHVMDLCEGYYKPNATDEDAGYNVTKCKSSIHDYNVSKLLDTELSIGPFNLSLADLGWSDDIQNAVDKLNDALYALFVVYVITVALTGVSIVACIAALVLYKAHDAVGSRTNSRCALINTVLATLGAVTTLTCSLIITIALNKGIKRFNRVADDVGVSASKGGKFLALTWTSFAFMLVTAIYWIAHKYMLKRQTRSVVPRRKGSAHSTRDGSHEMTERL